MGTLFLKKYILFYLFIYLFINYLFFFLHIFNSEWHPIRAAFRYVTQKPWKCIPLSTLTRVLNPVCIKQITSTLLSFVSLFSLFL